MVTCSMRSKTKFTATLPMVWCPGAKLLDASYMPLIHNSGGGKLPVSAGAHLLDNCGLKVNHHAPRDMFAYPGLREEGVENVITTPNGFVAWHLAIRLDAVFKAEQLPAIIAKST